MRNRLQRILVPADFSECSKAALDYAAFLARPFRADVEVLHVWNRPTETWSEGNQISLSAEGHILRNAADFVALSDREQNVRMRYRLEFGDLFSTIVELTAAEEFDLIVIGVHGHRRLVHLFNGHLLQRLTRAVTCPVIGVRARWNEGDEVQEAWSLDAAHHA